MVLLVIIYADKLFLSRLKLVLVKENVDLIGSQELILVIIIAIHGIVTIGTVFSVGIPRLEIQLELVVRVQNGNAQ